MAQLWFKFWAKEYLADTKVRCLNYEQRGILQTLWAFAWEEGGIPTDQEMLGNMLGIPAKAMRTHSVWIARFFTPDPYEPSMLISPRLEIDRAEADSKGSKARESAMQRWSKRDANAHANASETQMQTKCVTPCVSHAGQGQSKDKEKETPLTPLAGGDAADVALQGEAPPVPPKSRKPRKGKFESEDIAPENTEYLQQVYQRVPAEHPVTQEPVHKGAYALAARAFQRIVDSGEATGRELMTVGTLYYHAETLGTRFGTDWAEKANRAWDTRPKAMMHVSSLYGPEKRVYRQLLPIARELIAAKSASEAPPQAIELGATA